MHEAVCEFIENTHPLRWRRKKSRKPSEEINWHQLQFFLSSRNVTKAVPLPLLRIARKVLFPPPIPECWRHLPKNTDAASNLDTFDVHVLFVKTTGKYQQTPENSISSPDSEGKGKSWCLCTSGGYRGKQSLSSAAGKGKGWVDVGGKR